MSALGTVWSKDHIQRTLRAEQAYPVPCATLYANLYVGPLVPGKLAEVYRELAAGEREISLTLDQELEAQVEALFRAWEIFDPPFAWVYGLPFAPLSAYEGVTVRLSEDACVRRAGDGKETDLLQPPQSSLTHTWDCGRLPSVEEIDQLLPAVDASGMIAAGCHELARRFAERCAGRAWLVSPVPSPYEMLHVLGFVGMMEVLRKDPPLADAMIERSFHNGLQMAEVYRAAGIDGTFTEECWASSDLISVADYERFAADADRRLIAALKSMGFDVLFHMTGGIEGRLPFIREYGADAVALEDSKKGFVVDLGEVRRELGDGVTLWGNISPVVVRDGPAERIEKAVRENFAAAGPPYVVSCGSPLTPDTSVENVNALLRAAESLPDG
ncbi:MAG: hypothetical protein N2512_06365 [Armatimonadetes bacterium]|nr:hypothetical protein [Armatimonadota bacterium]